jgi:phasin family protein
MVKNLDDMQKLGKDNVDATLKSFGVLSKSFQAIAVEVADYSKKALEESAAATEKLIGAKSLDKVIEVQTSYLKSAYEGFLSQSAKLSELYAGLAQETCRPFESYAKAASAK